MISLLGIALTPLSHKEILERIEGQKRPLFVVTLNPEILLKAWKDPTYRNILHSADLRVVDGIGVVVMARLLYGVKLERFAGADLAEEIIRWAAKNSKKVFLLGGFLKTNQKAIKTLNSKFSILNSHIKGLGGDFTNEEAIEEISSFNPDILFVPLGAPKQEIFIQNLLQATSYKLQATAMGIGGAIDYWAYPWLRAPYIVRRIGLEWLWRVILQPWRLPRILKAVFVFPLACVYERILLQWQNEKH